MQPTPHPLLPAFVAAGIPDWKIARHYSVSSSAVRKWRDKEGLPSVWKHPKKKPPAPVAPLAPYADDEFTRFMQRARGRKRRIAKEAWIDWPSLTRVKNYDQATDEALASLRNNQQRKAS